MAQAEHQWLAQGERGEKLQSAPGLLRVRRWLGSLWPLSVYLQFPLLTGMTSVLGRFCCCSRAAACSREEQRGQHYGSWVRSCCGGAREVHGERHAGQCLEGAGYVLWQEKEMPGRCVS